MCGNVSESRDGTFANLCRSFAVSIVAFLMVLAVPRVGTAQVLYSHMVGTVTDQSGGAVPGAKVTVTQTETKLVRSVVTNASGTYSIATLPSGTYNVTITKQGFRTFSKTAVDVEFNSTARVDAKLEVGEITQTVEVSGAAPMLQTSNANVHHNISSVELENVPMAPGNNFEHLFQAIPGMNPPSSAHSIPTNPSRSLAFNSNGTSQLGNDVKIDGVSQWNIWVPENVAYIPSSDAIQTVNVSTNNYNINQGFAGGTSANVEIKSGTNQFHGDVYEYHYDNALQALEYFAPHNHITRSPKDVYNMFGGSVGGPIKKDKLFYFSNVEFTREYVFAQTQATMASPDMMAGDMRGLTGRPGSVLGASSTNPDIVYDPATGNADGTGRLPIFATNNPADAGTYNALCQAGDPGSTLITGGFTQCNNVIPTSRISPAAAKLMSLMPSQSLPTSTSYEPDNNFISRVDVHYRRVTGDEKVNWNATDKFTMFGHIGWLKYSTYNPQIFGTVGGPQASGFVGNEGAGWGHTISFNVTGNYIASPKFVVSVNGGMTRQTTNVAQLDIGKNQGLDILGIPGTNGTRPFEGSWPGFYISGFSNLGTQHNFMPYYRNDPQFFWSADANWVHGNHTVHFGGAVEIQHLNHLQPEWNAGGTTYPGAGGFNFGSGPTRCKASATSGTASVDNCFDTSLGSGSNSASNNFNSFSTFLLGLDTGWGKNELVPDVLHTNTKMYSLYVGDSWQTSSKLTTTLGVRWEYYPIPTRAGSPAGVERYDFTTGQMLNCGEGSVPLDCGIKVSKKLFSPRVGLAYRITPTFVVRAGYGITADPFNLINDLRTNYPIMIPLNQVTPNSLSAAGVMDAASLQNTPGGECAAYPAFCFGTGATLPVGIVLPSPLPSLTSDSNPIPGNVNLVTNGDSFTRGYIQSWNFTLQKSLPHGWVAQAGYVATRTVNQPGKIDLNVENPTTPGGCTPGNCGGTTSRLLNYNGGNTAICTSTASTALGCRTGGTSIITSVGANHYDSLQSTLKHRWANGYSISLAYTWSKTINVAGCNDEKSTCPSIPLPAFYDLNQGLAAFDRPKNFEAMFVAKAPFGPGQHWVTTGFASKVLQGWQVSGLITAVSNTPVSMSASGSSLNASGNHQNPDRICSSIGTPKVVGYGQDWFDTSCFSGVNTQRFGTSAQYVFHGPHLFNMDAAVFRTFKLTERFNLQFRAQAFNATNTPAFSNPSSSCGSIPSGSSSGCDSSSFGQVRGTTNFARHGQNFREFEFNAKLSF